MSAMNIVSVHCGHSPLIISCPHDGSFIPNAIATRLTARAQIAPDTDWHVSRLYDFARREFGASILVPTHSRYVADLNRAPDGVALYPGRRETGLLPVLRFDGEPVYLEGEAPTANEIRTRVASYWQPYHDALAAEIARVHAEHGRVLLWEAHSIRSVVPMFFDGRLPDLNIGTADGAAAGPALTARIDTCLRAQSTYTHVINGRFKGGYITRHYADPARGIEAVQLEMAQCTYMDEDSFAWRDDLARPVQSILHALLAAALA